jgi:hypothetical protein
MASKLFDLFGVTGAPGEIRTPDLLIRSQSLYPAELRAHMLGLQGEAHDTNHCQIIKARLAAQGLDRQRHRFTSLAEVPRPAQARGEAAHSQ